MDRTLNISKEYLYTSRFTHIQIEFSQTYANSIINFSNVPSENHLNVI